MLLGVKGSYVVPWNFASFVSLMSCSDGKAAPAWAVSSPRVIGSRARASRLWWRSSRGGARAGSRNGRQSTARANHNMRFPGTHVWPWDFVKRISKTKSQNSFHISSSEVLMILGTFQGMKRVMYTLANSIRFLVNVRTRSGSADTSQCFVINS